MQVQSLLLDFADVFLEELPKRLPSIRGIERQIDFVPRAVIPNRSAYRASLKKTKEIQCQFEYLIDKGHIREILSP